MRIRWVRMGVTMVACTHTVVPLSLIHIFWTTAAIGILCTLPKVLYAVIVAAVVVVMHMVLHPLSNKINKLSLIHI